MVAFSDAVQSNWKLQSKSHRLARATYKQALKGGGERPYLDVNDQACGGCWLVIRLVSPKFSNRTWLK
jgi:hypothetical protein